MALSPESKCLWLYLLDKCDNAGVIDLNIPLAKFQIVTDNEGLIESLGDRLSVLDNGKYYIESFVPFQFGELSESSNLHKNVIGLLKKHGLFNPSDTLQIPFTKGPSKGKGKGKGKVEEGECRGGAVAIDGRIAEFLALLPLDMQGGKGIVARNLRQLHIDGKDIAAIIDSMRRQIEIRQSAEPANRKYFRGLNKWFTDECWDDTDEAVRAKLNITEESTPLRKNENGDYIGKDGKKL